MESESAKKKRVLEQLRKRMEELDQLKEKLDEKNIPLDASPSETEGLMEEIKVPSLQVLKEEKKPAKKEKN
jgi:hypothetical protein